jgi:beta-phosphoglucomutase-like phosphatase (HAD superfamily)
MPPETGRAIQALIFDCDGVLVDTERDGHRVAFNRAFRDEGLDTEWSVERYGELLTTGGGKERMRRRFDETGWPVEDAGGRDVLIARLHRIKTDAFMGIIESGAMPPRPGVARMVDAALDTGLPVAVSSTSNERAVGAVVRVLLGLDPARCVVIEDSQFGLSAAKAAGMGCIVTVSHCSADEDFAAADRLVVDLDQGVDLGTCNDLAVRRSTA